MKFLIAVCSCHKHRDEGCHEAIRRSWGHVATGAGLDVRFFFGGESRISQPDETWLSVPDGYFDLPHKTKAIAQWFLSNTDYDYLFKCDVDTFIIPERLIACGFEQADYYGCPVDQVYMNGGPGYFISRKAAEILVASEVGNEQAEDRWAGLALQDKVVKRGADEKFWRYASWHYPVGMYGKKRYHPGSQWQATMARAYLGGKEGLDPRGLCFQDRNENGLTDGEYKVLLKFPGHPDLVKILDKKQLDFWKGQRMVREVLSPRW